MTISTRTLEPGQELDITFKATVVAGPGLWDENARLKLPNGTPFIVNNAFFRGVESAKVHPPLPKWQDHDVIAVRFYESGIEYTYTRARGYWPGVTVDQTDAKINELWRKGFVRHLIRNNQVVVGK